ncbi:unnamed protein product [Thelazia callipaeda]|uniref:Membrane-bound transcription factor site-2 protease n=1 Tax=Thelazia callipaeda TaxID=103827 RepID=A0A0N5D6M0_THECL|nr:unnamed protein product [Thelazia callipaeda]
MVFQIRFVLFQSPSKAFKMLPQNSLSLYLLNIWFITGVITAICFSFSIIFYLSRTSIMELSLWWVEFFGSFAVDSSVTYVRRQEVTTASKRFVEFDGSLEFVIPGWNIPWTQVPLYIVVLFLAALTHEFGHMLAALNTNVPVLNMGFVFLAIYIVAYVEIDTTALRRLSLFQKLKISCAGIWHNLVLAVFAYALYKASPFFLLPLYVSDAGVYVSDIQKGSPLSGPAGLQKGIVINGVSGCSVSSVDNWNDCLMKLRSTDLGFCVSNTVIADNIAKEMQLVENELDCCYNATKNHSTSYMCFYVREWINTTQSRGNQELLKYFSAKECTCLPSRYVAELLLCSSNEDCIKLNDTLEKSSESCVYPALLGNMSLMRISINDTSRVVLYVGYIEELECHVEVSNYVPRLSFVPALIPYVIELMAKYLFTFSFAFAVINAVPCIYLDGQYMWSNFVDIIFSRLGPRFLIFVLFFRLMNLI